MHLWAAKALSAVMSLKGKEKAVDADSAELPVQEDDLDNFFVKKTKRRHLPKCKPTNTTSLTVLTFPQTLQSDLHPPC